MTGYENQIAELLQKQGVEFKNGKLAVAWEFRLGDFPAMISRCSQGDEAHHSRKREQLEPPYVGCYKLPQPHAIFFDAFSPAKNPAMWTLPLFQNLFRSLEPARPCALTTYSRSTLIRATLLLAGFFVGVGHPTGMKEETTIAANRIELIDEPLDARWLIRAARSDNAEPLRDPVYHRKKLSPETLKRLRKHSQFNSSAEE